MRLAACLLAALALAAAGCGGGGDTTSAVRSATPPAPTATPTPTPTATATPPTATPTSPPATPTPAGGESQPGGGGDEAAARVPVELTVGTDGAVTPATVSVPAFLALELRVHNHTAGTISVTMEHADPPGALEVGSGTTGTRRLAGVRPGRYAITVAGAGRATLVSGTQPGP